MTLKSNPDWSKEREEFAIKTAKEWKEKGKTDLELSHIFGVTLAKIREMLS